MAEHKRRSSPLDHHDESFIQCFNLVIPYLPPRDIAALSTISKFLYKITKNLTHKRSSDASRNLENFAIPFINNIDSQPYDFFYYTPNQILPSEFHSFCQPWGTDPNSNSGFSRVRADPFLFRIEGVTGCECESEKCSEECSCLECGPSCRCDSECGNRVSQRGLGVKLKIVRDKKKGWSLYADEFIGVGSFVCEYAGELLTTGEARRRQEIYDELAVKRKLSPALLVVKEHLSSGNVCMRINIDATRVGNIARFINHSCDGGNLSPVIVRSSGALLPRVCFFASRDIRENEELTFCYGESRLKENGLRCFCGSSSCYGVLPSENT